MSNARTETVNSLNCVELATRLAVLVAIILADNRLNDSLEGTDTDELWFAAEEDGFTADTFCDAYTMLVDGGEITHFPNSVSYWVSSSSPIYDDAMDIVNDVNTAIDADIEQSSQQWESVPMEPYASMMIATPESIAFDTMFE